MICSTTHRGRQRLRRRASVFVLVSLLLCMLVLRIQTSTNRPSKKEKKHPYPPLIWYVDGELRRPDEIHHVAFAKVHKAASSTLYSAFIRFSLSRELNVIFPRDGHLLSEHEMELAELMPRPPSPFQFDILCNHMVFNQGTVKSLLPPDSVYVTILREPLQQMQSAYDYYKVKYNVEYLLPSANFTDFLTNAIVYEPVNPYQSFTNNRMSLDLGLPPYQIYNSSYIPTFLDYVEKVFDLVLIAERFDESIILLRRRLRWTMKDIVYIKLNQRSVIHSDGISPSLESLFKKHDQFDVALYDHFYKKFDRMVRQQGHGFQEEVTTFRGITAAVATFCEMNHPEAHLLLPRREWNQEFMFSTHECEIIHLDDLGLNNRARYWQNERLFKTDEVEEQ